MSDKITPKQLEALTAIAAGSVRRHNCGIAAWRTLGAHPTVVGKVMSLGLAKWSKLEGGTAELTDSGRAAIARATEGE